MQPAVADVLAPASPQETYGQEVKRTRWTSASTDVVGGEDGDLPQDSYTVPLCLTAAAG